MALGAGGTRGDVGRKVAAQGSGGEQHGGWVVPWMQMGAVGDGGRGREGRAKAAAVEIGRGYDKKKRGEKCWVVVGYRILIMDNFYG